jgi:hypothetical protein
MSVVTAAGFPSRYSVSAADDLTVLVSQTRLVPRSVLLVGQRWWNWVMRLEET